MRAPWALRRSWATRSTSFPAVLVPAIRGGGEQGGGVLGVAGGLGEDGLVAARRYLVALGSAAAIRSRPRAGPSPQDLDQSPRGHSWPEQLSVSDRCCVNASIVISGPAVML
jgi:hypothetical protein